MFILRQARQSRFSSYKVSKIKTTKVEFKIVKARELNIKEVLESFVKDFFLFQEGILSWEYKDKRDITIV
jgi:hypothetical protein